MFKNEYMYKIDNSVDKQLIIEYDGGKITNTKLYQESFELTENLCSENSLAFGSCESNYVKFRISNTISSLKNKWIVVKQVLNKDYENEFQIGIYKIESDVPTEDRNYRDITAYDCMYDIINSDITEWYNSLEFPTSLISFRKKFFEYLNIEYEDSTLPNDGMEIYKTINEDSISGKDIITEICQINGCFGNINRDGKFEFVFLKGISRELYPNSRIYPSDYLLPEKNKFDGKTGFDGNYIVSGTDIITKIRGAFVLKKVNGETVLSLSEIETGYTAFFKDVIKSDETFGEYNKFYILKLDSSDISYFTDKYGAEIPCYPVAFGYGYTNSEYHAYKTVMPEIKVVTENGYQGINNGEGKLYLSEFALRNMCGLPTFENEEKLEIYIKYGDCSLAKNYVLNTYEIPRSRCISCKYEDYLVKKIDKVQIRSSENDIGAVAGNGENLYTIEGNRLVFQNNLESMQEVANNLYDALSGYNPYRVCTVKTVGNPVIEIGTQIRVFSRIETIDSYIINRTLSGIQSLRDTYYAVGTEFAENGLNSTSHSIIEMKGKTNELSRTIKETISKISGEGGIESQIRQTAEEVSTKVSKGEVISEINQTPEQVTINANKINLNGAVTANNNVTIGQDGTINAKNGVFEGKVVATNSEFTGNVKATNLLVKDRIKLYTEGDENFKTALDIDSNGMLYLGQSDDLLRIRGSEILIQGDILSSKPFIIGDVYVGGNSSFSGKKAVVDFNDQSSDVNKGAYIYRGSSSSNTTFGAWNAGKEVGDNGHSIFIYEGKNNTFEFNSGITVSGGSSSSTLSDMRLKENISTLDERYSLFFDKLEAKMFKYADGTSGRFHLGYIAQDVKKAMDISGIDNSEFAGFIEVKKDEKSDTYRGYDTELQLRYEEFLPLHTNEIKMLKKRVRELENMLETQKEQIQELNELLNNKQK